MIVSVIKSLERAMTILNDIPNNIEKERAKTISSMTDVFTEFYDQIDVSDKDQRKRVLALKKSILQQVEDFCDTTCRSVKEDIQIVEE